jgi:hypothetical protein
MKNWRVIFLDVDGVLNSFDTMNTDNSLEMGLIRNLAKIVSATDAKIILTSTWRLSTEALRELMDTLMWYDLTISGYTQEGANMRNFENTPFEDVVPTKKYTRSGTYTYDRGAEIAMWMLQHDFDVEKFVILDDEDEDIKNWFPNNLVKTDFMKGLTEEDAAKAINLLS